MSFRGNGLAVEELDPVDAEDNAGDTDPPRPRLFCDRVIEVDRVMDGLEPKAVPPGLVPIPGCILMTPAAMPPAMGTRTAGGGGAGDDTGWDGGVT
jgi:hypothetical protein